MIFNFVVHRLHFLSRIPFAPDLFDALLVGWTAIRRPRVLAAMERFEAEVLKVDGVTLARHRYGGVAFRRGGIEVAHLHGNGLFDALVGWEFADELVTSGMARPHHVLGRSAWVSCWIESDEDVKGARGVFELALGWKKLRAAP